MKPWCDTGKVSAVLCLFLLLFFQTASHAATTYYVDATGGLDTNLGTSTGAPWQTAGRIMTQSLGPGDTILFKRGEVWRELLQATRAGTALGGAITYGAYGTGAAPQINGADLVTNWTGGPTVWQAAVTTAPQIVAMDQVTGTAKTSLGSLATERDWFWQSNTLYQYCSAGDPDTVYLAPGTEAGARYTCVEITQDHNVVENFDLRYANGYSVEIWDTDVSVQNNQFAANGQDFAVYVGSDNAQIDNNAIEATGGIYLPNNDTACRGNTLAVTGWGIYSQGTGNTVTCNILRSYGPIWTTAVTLYGNGAIISYNTIQNMVPMSTSGHQGIYIPSANNTVVTGNTISGYTDAIFITGGNGSVARAGTDISFNHLYGNRRGVYMYGEYFVDHRISYNLIFDNLVDGIYYRFGNHSNNSIDHNVIYGNAANGVYAGCTNTAWSLRNNILAENTQADLRIPTDAVFDYHGYNCYYSATPGKDVVVQDSGTNYTISQIALFEPSAKGEDPLFYDNTNPGYDFHLDHGSPCINTGTTLGGYTRDLDNNTVPTGAGPDMGAYEYQFTPYMQGLSWNNSPTGQINVNTQEHLVGEISCQARDYDYLQSLTIENLGIAEAGTDIGTLWLRHSATGNSQTATTLGQMTMLTNKQWRLNGMHFQVVDGSSLFLVADIAATAVSGRTCQFSLAAQDAVFDYAGGLEALRLSNTDTQVINAPVVVQTQLSLDLQSSTQRNVVKGLSSVFLGAMTLNNITGDGAEVRQIEFHVQDADGRQISPGDVLSELRLLRQGQQVGRIAAPFTSAGLCTLQQPLDVPAHAAVELQVLGAVAIHPAANAFTLMIKDNLRVNNGAMLVTTVEGKVFPLTTHLFRIRESTLAGTFHNYPNPFQAQRDRTTITFYLPQAAQVQLDVWNMQRKKVVSLANEKREQGMQSLEWDGRNGQGYWVKSGIYLLRIHADYMQGGEETLVRKIAVLR